MADSKKHDDETATLTYFAEPERAAAALLERQIDLACAHPVTTAVLTSFNGIVLILNQYRQAVAANDVFLNTLGISDPSEALGLRPGEAVSCRHAETAPNGCGTGKACITCGAVLAIVSSRRLRRSMERECLIDRVVDGRHEPLEFFVRATPINIEDTELTVVTLVDIGDKKRAEAVERMFIHDFLNCLQGLKGLCEMAATDLNELKLEEMEQIQDLTDYLSEMANAHRDLLLMENGEFACPFNEAAIKDVLSKVNKIVTFAGVARHKTLVMDGAIPDIRLMTDEVLLVRVLVNMAKNALEATEPGGEAKLRGEVSDGRLRLSVWNGGQIPEQTALRVFQRYFSTKPGNGRGLGTYSMKLIAEQYLQGQVSFQTSEAGTTFTLSLPL